MLRFRACSLFLRHERTLFPWDRGPPPARARWPRTTSVASQSVLSRADGRTFGPRRQSKAASGFLYVLSNFPLITLTVDATPTISMI